MRMDNENQETALFQLADVSPIGVYVVQDGRFRYVNPQFSVMTGFSAEDLVGRDCLALVLEEDRVRVRDAAVQLLKNRTREPYEYRVRSKDGSIRWFLESVSSIEHNGRAVVGNFMDITERKAREDSLREKSRRDPLTGLLNHGAFLEELYKELTTNDGLPHWLVMADVDGLKQVNDIHGHQIGDIVLKTVAAVMDRPGAIVGRYGGDEFVALLVGGNRTGADSYCQLVRDVLAETPIADFRMRKRLIPHVTFGLAGYPDDASSGTALIRAADDAMFATKSPSWEAVK